MIPYHDSLRTRLVSAVLLGCVSSLAMGSVAIAQDAQQAPAQPAPAEPAPAQTAAAEPVFSLEEIVVTARKREEGLQDTPISIAAFSAETLEARGTTRVDEIAAFTPNLQLFNSPGFGGTSASSAIYIRGVGQKDFSPFTEPGVGVYIDGVYVARSVGGIFDLVDVERIEVLRGPQGTLFGRNTIGGAVSITSKKPDFDAVSAKASGTVGSDDRIDFKGSFNLPLADNAAMKVSLTKTQKDGYVTRDDGLDLGNEDKFSWRAAVRWLPHERVEINLFGDGQRVRDNGPAFQLIGTNMESETFNSDEKPLTGINGGPNRFNVYSPSDTGYIINLPDSVGATTAPGSLKRSYSGPVKTYRSDGSYYYTSATGDAPTDNFSLLHNYLQTAQFYGSGGASGTNCFSSFGSAYDPQANTSKNCYGDHWVRSDGTNGGTAPSYSKVDIWGIGGTIDVEVSDTLSVKSITAYRDLKSSSARDGDHSSLSVVAYEDDPLDQWQISQEVQLQGSSFDDRFKWIVGLYYFQEKGINLNTVDFTPIKFQVGGKFDNTSLATFAQGTFEVTDKLSITPGLRWTHDKKKFIADGEGVIQNKVGIADPSTETGVVDCGTASGIAALNGLKCYTGSATVYVAGDPVLVGEAETDYKDLTPMLNVSYKWTDDIMTYATYSEGFKGGGFTHRTLPLPDLPGEVPTFEPETVKVYEVGFKAQAFDNRFQLNGAAFYTKYNNLQIQVLEGAAPQIKNVGKARIQGIELESKFVPAENWLIEGGLGLLDDKYIEFDPGITDGFRDPLQLSDQFEQISRVTANAGIQKEIPLEGMGSLTPRVDWTYRSKTYYDVQNTEEIAQPGYSLVNAKLSWANESKDYGIVFGVNNVFDKHHLLSATYNETFGIYEGVYGRGREWFLTLRAGF